MICVGRLIFGPVGMVLATAGSEADGAVLASDAVVALTSSTLGLDSTGGGGPAVATGCLGAWLAGFGSDGASGCCAGVAGFLSAAGPIGAGLAA